MEEFIAIVPLALAFTSMVATLLMLRNKADAEKKFVQALQEELEREIANKLSSLDGAPMLSHAAENLGNNDPALVRAIYREALRSAGSSSGGIVLKALNDLTDKDKIYISSTLKQNSMAGRLRYLTKLFRKAFRNVYGEMM